MDGFEAREDGGSVESGAHAMNSPRYGWAIRGASAVLVGSLFLDLSSSAAWAWSRCTSDRRAITTVGRDPKTCSAIGRRADTWVGSSSSSSASDVNVAGTVKTNEGLVQPGTGQEVDIAIKGPSTVVVDAVVVGGVYEYNKYRRARFLPPTLQPDQHYIPPFDFSHRVPTINYWFTCYHIEPGTALPEFPQALDVPLAGGAIFAVWMFVQRRRRKESPAS